MTSVQQLTGYLEQAARRLAKECAEARRAGEHARSEGLKGEADAFLLMVQELQEHGDPVVLLEALYGMEQAAAWTARLDEQKAAEFEVQGDAASSLYHARSARYSHGLLRGYVQARLLLGTSPER